MIRAATVLLVVFMLPTAGYAGIAKVSLQDALHRSLINNHLIKAADYEIVSAANGAAASRSRYLPHLYLEEEAGLSNAPTRVFMMKLDQGRFAAKDFEISSLNKPGTYHDFRTSLTIEQPLVDFTIGKGIELANKETETRNLALEARKQEIALKVYAAYLEVRRARASLKAAGQARADAVEHLRLAFVRSEAGIGLKSDQLRARTYLTEMEQLNIAAGNDLQLAMMKLANLSGGESGDMLDIEDDFVGLELAHGMAELQQIARSSRQDLKMMVAGVEKAALGVGLVRTAYLPTVYAKASYQMNDRELPLGRDNDSWMVGASLRWELFDGMRRGREIGQKSAMESAAAEYLTDYQRGIDLQVAENFLRHQEAAKRLEVARHAVLDAEEVVRLISKRFENSIATMVELLDAQSALNRARANLVEMENQHALSTAATYQSAGIFLQEVMK